jgi:hypothetical protein
MVAFDASVFVCYITRFTEENFATLISVIFIYKAIEKVIHFFPLMHFSARLIILFSNLLLSMNN